MRNIGLTSWKEMIDVSPKIDFQLNLNKQSQYSDQQDQEQNVDRKLYPPQNPRFPTMGVRVLLYKRC